MTHTQPQVLLVEDNPGDADLVRLRLVEGQSEAQISCVNRLSDALASLDKEEPVLILLDLNLPDSHGAETFRKVMKHSPNVPIVVLSGQDDEALAISAVHHGVQDYLVKGQVDGRTLARAISYAIERHRSDQALQESEKHYKFLLESITDYSYTVKLENGKPVTVQMNIDVMFQIF